MPIDIIFAFDATEGHATNDSSKAKDLMKNLLKSYNIAKKDTNIGLITYGNAAREVFSFGSKRSLESLMESIDDMSIAAGPRMASKAVNLATQLLLRLDRRATGSDVGQQIILFSLGENDASDKKEFDEVTRLLAKEGISLIIMAVNVGNDTEFANAVKNKQDLVTSSDSRNLRRNLGALERRSGNSIGKLIAKVTISFI